MTELGRLSLLLREQYARRRIEAIGPKRDRRPASRHCEPAELACRLPISDGDREWQLASVKLPVVIGGRLGAAAAREARSPTPDLRRSLGLRRCLGSAPLAASGQDSHRTKTAEVGKLCRARSTARFFRACMTQLGRLSVLLRETSV